MSFVFEKINKKEVKIVKYIGKEEYLIVPSFTFIDNYVYRVTCIDKYSLNNPYIKKIFIPRTIKSIHHFAFLGLKNINIDEFIVASNNENYTSLDGNLYSKDKKILLRYASGSLKEKFVLPSEVEIIENSAFENSKFLKKVIFNASLKSVKAYAFAFCENIKTIKINDSLEHIGDFAFTNHQELNNIKLPKSLSSLGVGVFRSIRNPNINISISSKNKNFKIYKGGLYSYNKEELYKYMGSKEDIYLSSHLKEIKAYAFSYSFIDSLTIPSNVYIIGRSAFKGSTIRDIKLSDNVETLQKSTFEYCKFLKNVILPKKLKTIEALVFSTCSSLENIDLPNSLSYIGDSAFASSKIKDIKLNSSISLSEDALKGSYIKI